MVVSAVADPDPEGSTAPRPARRTQRDRRDATIERLVDATISALIEVGYHRTSINEICSRAGVSHGGLFRHFATRLDLVEAAYRTAAAGQLAVFIERFDDELVDTARARGDDVLEWALRELQRVTSEAPATVLHELHAAARTDEELRRRIAPLLIDHLHQVHDKAERHPLAHTFPDGQFRLVLDFFLHAFTGLAVAGAVLPSAEHDDRCVALAVRIAHDLQSTDVGGAGGPGTRGAAETLPSSTAPVTDRRPPSRHDQGAT